MALTIGVRQRVVAFEPPRREHRALQHLRAVAARALSGDATDGGDDRAAATEKRDDAGRTTWTRGAVWMSDPRAFALASFLLSELGARTHPRDHEALVQAVVKAVLAHTNNSSNDSSGSSSSSKRALLAAASSQSSSWTYSSDALGSYVIVPHSEQLPVAPSSSSISNGSGLLVLLVYRPEPLLRLCWASARRAVRFVNAVVTLVTANAYISTLGGGHFLCRHLDQAKLMAKLQIAVSVGLQDPVLESKCRVNLAYGAMQAGRFRRAHRIIERERAVALELDSDELLRICFAARVYLLKTYRLHKEFLRNVGEPAKTERLHDNFYRQRIVRAAK